MGVSFLLQHDVYVSNFVSILQTSGSLYGALIGSVLAFNVADFLGLSCNVVMQLKLCDMLNLLIIINY